MVNNQLFPAKPLVLFDGVCNLCNASVQFIIEHDSEGKIMFCSLQSERGQAILQHLGMKTDDFDTFIFIENGEAYTRSAGILKEVSYFDGWWRFLSIFRIVPRPIRDFFYNIVAQNRYRWFGKKESCWLPTPELKARFLA
jgi:predicted DCC family thiol-disulfide oxidoreductase YuxK